MTLNDEIVHALNYSCSNPVYWHHTLQLMKQTKFFLVLLKNSIIQKN